MSGIHFFYAITNPPAKPDRARPVQAAHRRQTGLRLGVAVLAAVALLSLAGRSAAPVPAVHQSVPDFGLHSLADYHASEWGTSGLPGR